MHRRFGPYLDVLKTVWENRDRLGYAWRILSNGVCDGCSLGTYGMRDWTINGIHLCWIRLNLLRINTMPSLDPKLLRDVEELRNLPEYRLRRHGRLPYPMVRMRGEPGFKRVSWDEALSLIAERFRNADPRRTAFYLTARGLTNETFYVAQKVARFLGTNNIDYSARLCHSPSTKALKQAIGYGASTCSYRDLIGTDLIVLIGSNVANNQPVMMKYIHHAKKKGTKVAVVNPYIEPGLEKYWVPSSLDSMLLGTKVGDYFFRINVGGDIAFVNGVLKLLIENNWVDRDFIQRHTKGWDGLVDSLEKQSMEVLEKISGLSREEMYKFAEIYGNARTAVFIWSMGVTMHPHGMLNIRAIINLALSRGMVGRPKTGLMPIRGQSGVQGGAEVGVSPDSLPSGLPLNEENVKKFSELWGFTVPSWRGLTVPEMVEAAAKDKLDILYAIGGGLSEVLPDKQYVEKALSNIPLRIHHDIVLNRKMLLPPRDTVVILPATTRYEMEGGCTITTTERRIVYSPEIKGPRLTEALEEWKVLVELAKRVKPWLADKITFNNTREIREDIARAVPLYDGIQYLSKKGDNVQWGGERLCEGWSFNTEDGKARFYPVEPPETTPPTNMFILTTRRGKQFNSMLLSNRDMLTGCSRFQVIMNIDDMAELGLRSGDEVVLRSQTGILRGVVMQGNIRTRTIMAYWPECNTLIERRYDENTMIPAYRGGYVEVKPAKKSED
jgi:molybdopterin-dependent oxidoreductase alpha subunit